MGWLDLVTGQRAKVNAPRKPYVPWFLRIEQFLDRKAIKVAEASLTPGELAIFRQTRNAGPWRDAYRVIMQNRVNNANDGPERVRAEVQELFDGIMDREIARRG